MKQKVLLIDQDGVTAQYDRRILELAHERFGLLLYMPEDVTNFETHEIFGEEMAGVVERLALEEGFFSSLLPMDGAVTAFHEIIEASHEYGFGVSFCTKPKRFYKNPHCLFEKADWISRILGREHTDRIIFARDKTLVYGTVLLDDKPTVTGCVEPSWTHVLFDRPYNREVTGPRLPNWASWKEVLLPYLT